MIYGIGIDIVKVPRIRAAVERWGQRFLERVFTAEEIAYAYKKNDPFLSLAVRFAAKEAFIKAAPQRQAFSLTDIEVTNQDNGRPLLRLKGNAQKAFGKREIGNIHISMSHEIDYGVACVVIEGGE
jgi:phosphopantetheine--protein transferase-like protein